jgi:pimeloyl-ACP methyl ester carboxylesterase
VAESTVNHRVRKTIDGRSYIQTYHAEGTLDFVLFIHGVLGDHEETWRDTPIHLMAEQSLVAADFGSFGYRTRVFDSRSTRPHALQLITWMRTHLMRYERIYIVAHSMGGLITREACALLARSAHADDRALLSKVRHGFFVAVPIAGSAAAGWLQKIPLVSRINRKVAFLADPRVAGQELHDFYCESIRMLGPGARRPRFSLFTGSADGVVAEPPEWVYTEDDRHEGVVEGSHASIKLDQTTNSTLLRRIVQIIDADRAVPTSPVAPTVRARSHQHKPTDVIVLACSATKSTAGECEHPGTPGLPDMLADAEQRARAIQKRTDVKALIEAGRLEGREFNEGNRRFRQQNAALVAGPDFGGLANAPKYVPAFRRYMGRSFQALPDEWERFLALPETERPVVVIVSGLYGLVRIDDVIQNYDCHLSDVDVNTGRSLSEHWQSVLTDVLLSHLAFLERRGHRLGRVLNLLAEDIYSGTLDWPRIGGSLPVWHQRFERSRGREALDNVGVWMRSVVVQPSVLDRLRLNVDYDDPRYTGSDRCRFVEAP